MRPVLRSEVVQECHERTTVIKRNSIPMNDQIALRALAVKLKISFARVEAENAGNIMIKGKNDLPENANSGSTSKSKSWTFALASTASARVKLLSTSPKTGEN
ncbi:hypothetical protein BPAE_0500g00060 [Botrytis paeoniae]|uniref:Uncharacterized protein n=1 Tax=Botrytis paeoniae TaxID=278948 RepID=A0A4Z1EY02_9HELO|nr:hypothetical protein BPAE_0500g00060 [Botrytis paeoniae]